MNAVASALTVAVVLAAAARAPDRPPRAPPPPPASAAPAVAVVDASGPSPDERVPDIEYVPTPQNVVDKMLEAAKIRKTDVVYDLGRGDGRIIIQAAEKFGVNAVGYDIDPVRVAESRDDARRLVPELEKLEPGSRIVSHDFAMEGVEPETTWTVIARDHRKPKNREHYVYLWKTPLEKTKK